MPREITAKKITIKVAHADNEIHAVFNGAHRGFIGPSGRGFTEFDVPIGTTDLVVFGVNNGDKAKFDLSISSESEVFETIQLKRQPAHSLGLEFVRTYRVTNRGPAGDAESYTRPGLTEF